VVYWVPQWKFDGSYDDDRIPLEKAISNIFMKNFFDKVMYSSLDNQLYLNGLINGTFKIQFKEIFIRNNFKNCFEKFSFNASRITIVFNLKKSKN